MNFGLVRDATVHAMQSLIFAMMPVFQTYERRLVDLARIKKIKKQKQKTKTKTSPEEINSINCVI